LCVISSEEIICILMILFVVGILIIPVTIVAVPLIHDQYKKARNRKNIDWNSLKPYSRLNFFLITVALLLPLYIYKYFDFDRLFSGKFNFLSISVILLAFGHIVPAFLRTRAIGLQVFWMIFYFIPLLNFIFIFFLLIIPSLKKPEAEASADTDS